MKKHAKSLLQLLLALGLSAGMGLAAQTTGGTGGGAGQGGNGGGGRTTGGNYGGPGDTVPPGGNGGGGTGGGNPGGPPRVPPGVNPPGGGYAPGANPLAPPPFLPNGPGDPSDQPTAPRTPGARPLTPEPYSWQLWWHYNRWNYLRPNQQSPAATTGSGGFFLGRGQAPQALPRRAGSAELRNLVQPSLIQVLESDVSAELAGHALLAYAKLRDIPPENEEQTFETVLLPRLRDGNLQVSEHAILALGVRGEDAFFTKLAGIVNEEDLARELLARELITERQRFFALVALGLLADRTGDESLRLRIDAVLTRFLVDRRDPEPILQAAALLALGHCPLPTDDELATADGLPQRPRTRVDQVLTVLAFFEHEDSDVLPKSQAPRALARLVQDAPESLRKRVLRSFLNAVGPHSDERAEVVGAAIQGLGMIATAGSDPLDTDVRRELESLAYGPGSDLATSGFAVLALARVGSRPGPGEDPMAGYPQTKRLLLRRLSRGSSRSNAWTALGLGLLEVDAAGRGTLADADVTDALRDLLEDARSEELAGATAVALGLTRDLESEPLLAAKVEESGNEVVRGYAALALGMIGQPTALDTLRQHVARSASQPFAIEQGAIALAILGDQDVGPILLQTFEDAPTTVQQSIASAMGWIRDPRALQDLTRRMNDLGRTSSSRGWSAVAIGRIADVDEWPWVARLSTDVQYEVPLSELVDPAFGNGVLDLK